MNVIDATEMEQNQAQKLLSVVTVKVQARSLWLKVFSVFVRIALSVMAVVIHLKNHVIPATVSVPKEVRKRSVSQSRQESIPVIA